MTDKTTERLSPVLERMALSARDADLIADAELEWAVGGLTPEEFEELRSAVEAGWGGLAMKRAVDMQAWERRQRTLLSLPAMTDRTEGGLNLLMFFSQMDFAVSRSIDRIDALLRSLSDEQLDLVAERDAERYPVCQFARDMINDELSRRAEGQSTMAQNGAAS